MLGNIKSPKKHLMADQDYIAFKNYNIFLEHYSLIQRKFIQHLWYGNSVLHLDDSPEHKANKVFLPSHSLLPICRSFK